MQNLPNLVARCRQALDDTLEHVRASPLTAISRGQQIQAMALLRTLDAWHTRTPYPEQPPTVARLVVDLVGAVLGEGHPRASELRKSLEYNDPGTAPAEEGSGPLRVCLACRRCNEGSRSACDGCGGALVAFDRASLVDGRYLRTREIGRGAMGVVYEAIDIFLERDVALKLVAEKGPTTGAVLTSFRREAAALAAIRNDHVVQVYTFGVHDGAYYLAMERVVGRDLETILTEHATHGSTLPVPLAVTILARLASGLAAVHEAGVLHRDIKPSNVVIEERTGRAVLVDFGLALRRSSNVDLGSAANAGTPLYMAPELVTGSPSTAPEHWNASDIYAFGCTAFELIVGRPPFAAENVADLLQIRVAQPPPWASSIRPGVAAFDEALHRALARDPNARPATALDLARDLEQALDKWLTPEPTQRSSPTDSERRVAVVVAETAGYKDGARVLVVDDDDVFRRIASRCAELAFYQCPVRIEAVGASEAAILCAQRAMPDLVVLDYSMPGEDGVTTLTRLRALPGGDRTRVVVVSASVSNVEEWRFRALGVMDFVAKPIRFQAFVELLADIAARAGWQNALIAPRPRVPQ